MRPKIPLGPSVAPRRKVTTRKPFLVLSIRQTGGLSLNQSTKSSGTSMEAKGPIRWSLNPWLSLISPEDLMHSPQGYLWSLQKSWKNLYTLTQITWGTMTSRSLHWKTSWYRIRYMDILVQSSRQWYSQSKTTRNSQPCLQNFWKHLFRRRWTQWNLRVRYYFYFLGFCIGYTIHCTSHF